MRIKKPIFFVEGKTDTGFSAFTETYPISTTGSTMPEVTRNTLEAA